MKRRDFLIAGGLAPFALAGAGRPGGGRARAPFKVLYSNDTTNITSCVSPYHAARADFTDAMLRASIDEAAGAGVQMLQPGMGWIPWWKSKVYPAPEHYRYYQEKYGLAPNTFGKYMLAGGDLVKTFTGHCRARGVTPFISLRLNDGHGLETVGTGVPQAAHTVSRFYEDHYRQWRIGPEMKDWNDHVLDWAIPEVRAHKFAFIRELCENYDLDGFELDFMRHSSFFNTARTGSAERRRIMTGFVGQVRELLDRTARPGRRRWLCARIPAVLEGCDRLGLDVAELAGAGVDMFNLSCSYFTVQQTDVREIRRRAPETAIYLELCHSTLNGKSTGGYDSFPFLRTTEQQLYTTAHLALEQGADGVSLFNFAYYREHGKGERGPFNEPPFEALGQLGDREWLARQPQWWFMSSSMKKPLVSAWPLPRALKAGEGARFVTEMAPTEHQTRDGLLRLMTESAMKDCRWEAALNGVKLSPAPYARKPLPHPYDAWLGDEAQFACFHAPRAAVKAGENEIEVRMLSGAPVKLGYWDLALP